VCQRPWGGGGRHGVQAVGRGGDGRINGHSYSRPAAEGSRIVNVGFAVHRAHRHSSSIPDNRFRAFRIRYCLHPYRFDPVLPYYILYYIDPIISPKSSPRNLQHTNILSRRRECYIFFKNTPAGVCFIKQGLNLPGFINLYKNNSWEIGCQIFFLFFFEGGGSGLAEAENASLGAGGGGSALFFSSLLTFFAE